MRWSDLRAFIAHLPATSHFRRHLDPEAARRAELTTVEAQLLMAVHDAVWDSTYAAAGSDFRPPRLFAQLLADDREDEGKSAEREAKPARKPQKSPSELRALVAERIRT